MARFAKFAPLVAVVLLLAGCMPVRNIDGLAGSTTQPAAELAPEASGKLTTAALANGTYSGIYEDAVTLRAGSYEGEPFLAGDPARPTVQMMDGPVLHSDLDGNGAEDAVVFLVERGGGTGNFIYVAAQLNRGGRPINAGAVRIEDRVQIKSAAVDQGVVQLEVIAPGPGDGACCPTYKVNKAYSLKDGRLVETGKPDAPEKVSNMDLRNTQWRLVELHEGQPALPDSVVTLRFDGAQLGGQSGCNTYDAGFTLGADNPFVMAVGPVTSTQTPCPDPLGAQETAFLTALQQVSQWGWIVGQLALYYPGPKGLERLLFAPLEPEGSAPDKPAYVRVLEEAYGAPSQAAFGSAVFYTPLAAADDLEQLATETYQFFVGDLWARYGEDAWMGPWREVYARLPDTPQDVVAELRAIADPDAALSVPMILDVVEGSEQARTALAAAFDDPAVTELRVFNLGDGGAMSGLLIAGRRATTGEVTILTFLMD